ncbi:UDP-N-acetylmuramoyl-L-alanine--D-glutamate ligase [Patescibacteria group bacterium]|nr:UDP-N-acetylmuramoyl-L-alanine--D-glutamate ligase [Patescibacteria group bacterium]MBU4511860.1 UDP-N-acetylmuramoyl-L-alanine--D-glutamate ligase [Patescibacteria group bacterium]MCG2693255.1 UDP-N-acetylmuramoyl-L-alanine--D-glutamate ligase [Candidatus Parcubacteria bacterium]
MANFKELKNKKICILGLGLENYALVRFILKKKIFCEITVCDARGKKELGERYKALEGDIRECRLRGVWVNWRLGKNYDKNLQKFSAKGGPASGWDVIICSPGYSLLNTNLKKARMSGAEITSAMKLFFELSPRKNIIGVTGTKGKGTVSSLIYSILKRGGKRVWLGGNIGVAPFEFINKIKKNDWVVLELSSFQLEDMDVSPKIAVFTNFYKEHLAPADPNNPNFHRSMRDYWQAKGNIFKHQKRGDKFVANQKLKARLYNLAFGGKVVYFKKSELKSNLIGEHNKENIAAAVEVAKLAGVSQMDIKKAVAEFKPLEHRLEFIRNVKGTKYYNDSFATIPESTIIALRSFEAPIVLLAGGADKGSDFKDLAQEIKARCKAIILLRGKGTDKIKKQLLIINYQLSSEYSNLKQAVRKAQSIAQKGDIVLLSTGCASFGMFKNYKERGKMFKQVVRGLK